MIALVNTSPVMVARHDRGKDGLGRFYDISIHTALAAALNARDEAALARLVAPGATVDFPAGGGPDMRGVVFFEFSPRSRKVVRARFFCE